MKITNRLGLPSPLEEAVKNDTYSMGKADISVTGLLNPPRQTALIKRYWDEIEEDVADRIWALMGSVIHGILERADSTGITEKRLFMDVEGWTVSGAMDRIVKKDKHLSDYKTTSAFKIKDGVPEQFEWQVNFYRELCLVNGIDIQTIDIVAILRDWSKMNAMREADYPQQQVVVLPVNVWPRELTQDRIKERVKMHQDALVKLPLCTPEDMWQRPTKYAVKKEGAKRAVKLYDTLVAAEIHANTKKDLFVETRLGENIRCQAYCSCSKQCQELLEKE